MEIQDVSKVKFVKLRESELIELIKQYIGQQIDLDPEFISVTLPFLRQIMTTDEVVAKATCVMMSQDDKHTTIVKEMIRA